MDYNMYELKEKRGIRWVNLDKNKALTGIQMRYKATTTNEQSAFKGYVNSDAITNIRVRGIKALQYLKYQDLRLKEYLLRKQNGMKVLLQVFAILKSKKTNEDVKQVIQSRRYSITNEGERPNVLNQMAIDVKNQAEVMEVSESGLVIPQIDKLKFNYDKYNPTPGGKFIPLPKWVSNKKACISINIKNQDEKCFKYSVQCGICKVYEKDHPERVSHYKSLNDELNWDNASFPSSDVDIGTCEQNITKQRRESSGQCLFSWPRRKEAIHPTLQTDQGSKGNSSNQFSKTGGWGWLPLFIHQKLWQVDRKSNQQA